MSTTPSLPTIQSYIENWDSIRQDSEQIKTYLLNADSFSFTNSFPDAEDLHMYPGIDFATQKMYMIILDAAKDAIGDYSNLQCVEVLCDNPKSSKFNPFISPSATIAPLGPVVEELSAREAISRIVDWRINRNSWIDTQAALTDGIFSAFAVPSTYMPINNQYTAMFSLKTVRNKKYADLIMISNGFYNIVRPIPPFGGKDTKIKFSLLPY